MDHPYLVVHSASAPGAAEAQKKLQEEEAEGLLQGTCGVCHDHLEDPVLSSCQHVFCRACMMEYMEGAQGQAKCPSCEKPLSVDLSGSAAVSLICIGFPFFSSLSLLDSKHGSSRQARQKKFYLLRGLGHAGRCGRVAYGSPS